MAKPRNGLSASDAAKRVLGWLWCCSIILMGRMFDWMKVGTCLIDVVDGRDLVVEFSFRRQQNNDWEAWGKNKRVSYISFFKLSLLEQRKRLQASKS